MKNFFKGFCLIGILIPIFTAISTISAQLTELICTIIAFYTDKITNSELKEKPKIGFCLADEENPPSKEK